MIRKRYEWLAALVLIAAGAWLRFRIGYHWLFAGSDSYGYLKLADQLWQHGRYALSPADPPHLGRMPLYSMFLAVVKREHMAEMSGGDGWFLITNAQIYVELLTLPLVYLMARKLAGPIAAVAALALAALMPFTPLYTSAVLTESLATSLTTITIAVLVLGGKRPMVTFPAVGALLALSTLLRPDGILLAVALVPAAWAYAADRKRRLTLLATSLLAFSVVFSPWVVRNLRAFGKPAIFGGRVDRFTRPMPDYHGWWRWITSWGSDEKPQTFLSTCFYNPPCSIAPQMLPMEAFDSGEERTTVDKLIALRSAGGHNAQVSEGFEKLGAEREWHHPLRSFVSLPLQRAWHMWISRYDEILQHPTLWPAIRSFGLHAFLPLTFIFSFLLLFGTAFLVREQATRLMALVVALPIFARTLILCFNNYSMPRYTVETWPLAYVIIAWAAVEVTRQLRKAK
jgi:4-amino-4-deoxy-L-arabinose transferase-like glycosyltransferase